MAKFCSGEPVLDVIDGIARGDAMGFIDDQEAGGWREFGLVQHG